MAAQSTNTNTPTEPNKEEKSLILYRLEQVEEGLKALGKKMDNFDVIKRSDLTEFKDAIFERFAEKTTGLQGQIDELDTKKASQSQVDDLRGLVKWAGAFFTTVIAGLIVFYITNRP